jgi:diguanylate cyclase (GGDEF)-like protein
MWVTESKVEVSSPDPLFASYVQLALSLVPDLTGIALFDGRLKSRGTTRAFNAAAVTGELLQANWNGEAKRDAIAARVGGDAWTFTIPLEQSDGTLLGVFCVQQSLATTPTQPARYAKDIEHRLKPLLDCVHRELAAQQPTRSRVQALTERTAELEWLFNITGNLKGAVDDRKVIEQLLSAATERMDSALGVLWIPGKRICIETVRDPSHGEALRSAFAQTKQYLLTWVERQNRPLVVNTAGRSGSGVARCKILAVPVVRESGAVVGLLALYNPPGAPNFGARHTFLARHLGRQVGSIVESQFDLMTGLYTRGGMQQMCGAWDDPALGDRTILYIDVDHMHIVNELHGFELGNELIVRIADLLGSPILPEGAIAARISADRFAVVLPSTDIKEVGQLAEQLLAAARKVKIGPAEKGTLVSLSCGIASLVCMPQGLDRAIAAAELACKTAKNRGRDRIEVYSCDDNSMMRSHGDAIAIGQLRAALKTDRLLLYAQRIVPLRNSNLPGGYEILLRLREEDGSLVLPGPLIQAAARFQVLPTVDRWVTKRALEMLAPYRSMLGSRGIGMSINVSGQSIGDEVFVSLLAQQIKAARLPGDCLTIEITEQAALTNLVRANELIRQLRSLGCQFALDDFGTGANSLTTLKQLQIARVKIDGSFVRDVATDRNSRATVRAIVELADVMSIDTVAEYVETSAVAEEVRNLGVDYGQGYAFGQPEPLSAILEGLSTDESQRLHRLFLES